MLKRIASIFGRIAFLAAVMLILLRFWLHMLINSAVLVIIVLVSIPLAVVWDRQVDFNRNDEIVQREATRIREGCCPDDAAESSKIAYFFWIDVLGVILVVPLSHMLRSYFWRLGIPDNVELGALVAGILLTSIISYLSYPFFYVKELRKRLRDAQLLDLNCFPPPSDKVLALTSNANPHPAISLYMRQARIRLKDARLVIMKLRYFSKR
jgi:hypothetical protein